MQKKSRVPLFAKVSSAFLPYGVVTAHTLIESTIQFWLFPFWMYVHDFGNWIKVGIIWLSFVPTYPLPLLILGLLWTILGFYICRILHRFYEGQVEAKSAWVLVLRVLVFQIIMTISIALVVMTGYMVVLVIPLPIHTVIVIVLLKVEIRRVDGNPVSWWPKSSQT
ncbi:MAG: hypothetical protein RTU09_02470 [Candidatus Thorarchaeota archaeon]